MYDEGRSQKSNSQLKRGRSRLVAIVNDAFQGLQPSPGLLQVQVNLDPRETRSASGQSRNRWLDYARCMFEQLEVVEAGLAAGAITNFSSLTHLGDTCMAAGVIASFKHNQGELGRAHNASLGWLFECISILDLFYPRLGPFHHVLEQSDATRESTPLNALYQQLGALDDLPELLLCIVLLDLNGTSAADRPD